MASATALQSHGPSSTASEPGVLRAAEAAVALANLRGASLLRVHAPLLVEDPWRLLGGEDVALAMDDPWAGLRAVGFGGEASGGVDDVLGDCSRDRELIVEAGAEGRACSPVAFAALPFDASARSVGHWSRWPTAVARVPSVVAWRRGDDRGAVAQVRVRPDESPAQVAARAQSRLDELSRRVARAGAARGAWVREVGAACPGLLARAAESRDAWCARVERALSAIEAGRLKKVVPARAVHLLPPSGYLFDLPATLDALRRRNPGALCFAVSGPGGWFLGASPELLLRLDGDRVESRPLAGTAPRGADAERDAELERGLLASAKDRREHRLVVEALTAALGSVCAELDVAASPRVARLPTMLHLETQIVARLAAPRLLDLLGRMSPTPAVGGWPTQAALDWLREEEPVARGLFAGPVGWAAPGEATFALGIRSALVRPDSAVAWAGAGIVRGSDPEVEWRETHLKLGVVREALCARRSQP